MISQEALAEFKLAWREEYGMEISDAEALDLGINLLIFFSSIYRPVKKEWESEHEAKKNYR